MSASALPLLPLHFLAVQLTDTCKEFRDRAGGIGGEGGIRGGGFGGGGGIG